MFNVISGMAGAGRTGAFWRDRVEALLKAVAGPVAGFAVFVLAWQAVAMGIPEIPTPGVTWHAAQALFADPFYDNGPNDKGIGWNLLASLQRVAVGFGLAAIVGIPAGFAIGRYAALRHVLAHRQPAAAGVAAGLAAAGPVAVQGRQSGRHLGDLHLFHLAHDRQYRRWGDARAAGLPERGARAESVGMEGRHQGIAAGGAAYVLTGVRLSIGTAWLVIVAAEMLTGGTGIGFWLWDEWNNLKVEHIVIAIFVIGIVGLALETLLVALARRFTYAEE